MAEILPWIATVATIIGAFLTAANLGARVTGSGFAVFLAGSLAWLATGFLTGQPALTWTNAVLTLLNIFGIWRWLGRQASVEEGGKAAAEASAKTPGEALFPVSLLSRAVVRTIPKLPGIASTRSPAAEAAALIIWWFPRAASRALEKHCGAFPGRLRGSRAMMS